MLQAQLESNDYASHHVDLIILDINMPGMNDFTTLSHLKGMAEPDLVI